MRGRPIDRRTVVLGVGAAAAVAAAVLVTTGGRGSTGSPERKAVAAYVEQVNALQNRMHAPLARVMLAYASFGRNGAARRPSATQLGAAAAALTRLDRRLAALTYPPEAAKLRSRLVVLVRREAAITNEVRLLARFAPRYVATLTKMQAARAALNAKLGKIAVPTPHVLRGTKKQVLRAQRVFAAKAQRAAVAQAAAIDEYDRSVAQALARLSRLHPPPALAPEYRAQVAALHQVAAVGAILAARLRSTERSDVAVLGTRFARASRTAGTVAVQRAQVAAIRAYNRRARAVGSAAGAVEDELARLRRDLP